MKFRSIALAVFFPLSLQGAHAVEVSFRGLITQSNSMSGQPWGLETTFQINQEFSGHFTYDLAAEANHNYQNLSGTETRYSGNTLYVEIGGVTVLAQPYSLTVIDGAYAGLDQFVAWADKYDSNLITVGAPMSAGTVGLGFYDSSQQIFQDKKLPSSNLHWEKFDQNMFSLAFYRNENTPLYDAYFVGGIITSVTSVPEPSSVLLVTCGVAVLVGSCKRRTV